jgi:hypothetical protein
MRLDYCEDNDRDAQEEKIEGDGERTPTLRQFLHHHGKAGYMQRSPPDRRETGGGADCPKDLQRRNRYAIRVVGQLCSWINAAQRMAAKLRPRARLPRFVLAQAPAWLKPAAGSFSGLLDGALQHRALTLRPLMHSRPAARSSAL